MVDDTLELAENKLLLLYILEKIKLSISKNQVTEIVLENNFINYFTLQQYITELVSSNFIEYLNRDGKQRLCISEKGKKVLNLFLGRISEGKKVLIDEYLNNNINNIKKAISITADYTIENGDNFIVNLRASENNATLIDIKINVVSNKQARDLCSKWKTNSSDLYTKIIKLLTED